MLLSLSPKAFELVIIDKEMDPDILPIGSLRVVETNQFVRYMRTSLKCRHLVEACCPFFVKVIQIVSIRGAFPLIAVISVIFCVLFTL